MALLGGHGKHVLDTEEETDNKERRDTVMTMVKTRTGLFFHSRSPDALDSVKKNKTSVVVVTIETVKVVQRLKAE